METKRNRAIDPSSPIMMICLFCMNFFYGDRKVVHVHPKKYPMMDKPCPLCQIPLQLLGSHPGAWGGSFVVGIEPAEPRDS